MHQAASAVAMGIILWLSKSFDHLTTTPPPSIFVCGVSFLCLFSSVFCLFCVEKGGLYVPQLTCEGQRRTCRGQFSSYHASFRIQTRVVGLRSKHLFPPSHTASPHVAFYLCISEVSSTNGMAVIFTLRHRDVKKLGHSHRVSYDATANVTKFQITSALLQRTGTWVDGVAERYNSPRMYKAPGSVPAIAN